GQGWQARNLQDRERRKPAGPWRHPDSRLRRLGALLLHRLPQPPPGLSEGVRRSSRELGIRRPAVLQGVIFARDDTRGRQCKTAALFVCVPGAILAGIAGMRQNLCRVTLPTWEICDELSLGFLRGRPWCELAPSHQP